MLLLRLTPLPSPVRAYPLDLAAPKLPRDGGPTEIQ